MSPCGSGPSSSCSTPAARASARAGLDVGRAGRAAGGGREGKAAVQRGRQDQPGVAPAGHRHDARAARPVGQGPQARDEGVGRGGGVEAGTEQRHDVLAAQQLGALLLAAGAQAQDGPARQPAHRGPERVAGRRPAAPEQAGERERVELARSGEGGQRGRGVGEPARAVRLGREERIGAERVGADLELARRRRRSARPPSARRARRATRSRARDTRSGPAAPRRRPRARRRPSGPGGRRTGRAGAPRRARTRRRRAAPGRGPPMRARRGHRARATGAAAPDRGSPRARRRPRAHPRPARRRARRTAAIPARTGSWERERDRSPGARGRR